MPSFPILPPIYKLPPELWSHVGSYLDSKALDAITKVSKICRNNLTRALFKTVNFEGFAWQIESVLRRFVSGVKWNDIPDVRGYVSQARISVFFIDPILATDFDEWGLSTSICLHHDPSTSQLPKLIHRAIKVLPPLLQLAIELHGCRSHDVQCFLNSLYETEKWSIRNLRVNASPRLSSRIIKHCMPITLKGLHIQSREGIAAYSTAKLFHGGLEKLHIDVQSWDLQPAVSIPCLREDMIGMIVKDFPLLRWLVLYDSGKLYMLDDDDEVVGFENQLDKFIRIISSLPMLERLALTLHDETVAQVLARGVPSGADEVTEQEATSWYSAVIHRISSSLPHILRIYVMGDYPKYYYGARNKNGDVMRVTRRYIPKGRPSHCLPVGLWDDE